MTAALYAIAHFVLGAVATAIPTLIVGARWFANHAAELEQIKAKIEVLEASLPKPKS